MKIRTLGIVISIFLYACSEPKNVKEETISKNNETRNSINAPELVEANDSKEKVYSDFSEFWKDFRIAVLNNDTAKVHRLTKFPFETRGPMDSDPIVKFDKKDFPKVFRVFLKEPVLDIDTAGNDINTDQYGIIKGTKGPGRNYTLTEDWARVGNLEFRKVNNEWRLTFAYLEYPTIEEINRK